VGGLDVGNGDFNQMFQSMKAGLQEPLKGMGTAFSSSLFGLGGSLILGFLDIQANHAQNRFFNELEEWLSGVTQLVDRRKKAPSEVSDFPEQVSAGQVQFQDLLQELQRMNDLLEKKYKEDLSLSPVDKTVENKGQ